MEGFAYMDATNDPMAKLTIEPANPYTMATVYV